MWGAILCFCLVPAIYWTQVNGASPVCTGPVTEEVDATETVDFLVYDLNQICTDADPEILTYSFVSGNVDSLFKLVNGQLQLAKAIVAQIPYRYVMVIETSDPTSNKFQVSVTVTIRYNDNANDPVINNLPVFINIPEDTQIGTLLNTCTVTDADQPKGTLSGQTRINQKFPFGVFSRKFTLDSRTCELFVNTLLDYEQTKKYVVTLIAKDLDPLTSRSVNKTITINVDDVNDNPPVCTSYYTIVLTLSSASIGQPLYTANCSDADSGVNGQVSYSIDATNTNEIKNHFDVDSSSGQLSLKATITSTTIPYYEVLLNVEDAGGASKMETKVLVRVVVTDVIGPAPASIFNRALLHPALPPLLPPLSTESRPPVTITPTPNMPTCRLNGVNLVISEFQAIETDIYDLQCTDPDGDQLTYSIIQGDAFTHFDIVNGNLQLRKNISGDFTSKLSLHVTVTDDSASALSTNLILAVYVTNENDNNPVLRDLPDEIMVSENQPIGAIINSCSVNDKDSKKGFIRGGQTRVGFTDPGAADAQSWFIDSLNCDLYVNTVLDYETTKTYSLSVSAWDLSLTGARTASRNVIITIIDYNDNSPICPATLSTSLAENAAIGTLLETVACTDADSGDNAKVYFKIDDANIPLVKAGFTVGGSTGEVTLQAALDFETTESYDIAVVAYDGGSPSLSATTIIQLTVTDIADGAGVTNTSIPVYAVKPTVDVQVIQAAVSQYEFKCNFPLSTDPLYYLVNWYIDGYSIFTTPRIVNTADVQDLTKLTEQKLLDLGVTTVGFDVHCEFRASFADNSYLGIPSVSDPQFIGIKVLTPEVTLKQGETGNIQIQATAPIGCATASCNYPLYTFLQQRGFDCSATEEGEDCGVTIDTATYSTIYNVPIKGGITFQYGRGSSDSIVKLRSSATYAAHPIWSNYTLSDVTVKITQDTALIEGSKCAAFVDPRIVTFDRGLLDLQDIGVFTLYSHAATQTEVQIQTVRCDNETTAHCICGIAVATGRTVYKLNKCGLLFTDIRYTLCDDPSADVLKVEMLEKFYQIYLPTGTRITIFLRPNNMNIYVYPSVMDIKNTGGLCGYLSGDSKDDLALRAGGTSTEKVSKAKFEITTLFFDSWRVNPPTTLFDIEKDGYDGGRTLYTNGQFVYDPQAYSCVNIGNPLTGRTGTPTTKSCSIFTDINRIQTDASSAGFRVVEKQDCLSGGAGRRRKRSIPEVKFVEPVEDEQHYREKRSVLSWRNGWTEENAHEFCNQLFNESSMVSLCKDVSLVDISSALIACYQDIELSGSANYSLDTMSSIRSQCIHEISSNDSFKVPEIPGQPPKYDVILAVACPGECTNQGECVDGKCICDQGFGGIDCAVDITDNPLLVVLENGGHCDLQVHKCDEISAFGETFVAGDSMRCKTRYFELREGNQMVLKEFSQHMPFLESISEAVCVIPPLPKQTTPDGAVLAYGYEITLTNDGAAYSDPNYMAIYNSECQSCEITSQGVTCTIKPGYCVAKGICYTSGDAFQDNQCYTCQTADDAVNSTNSGSWARRTDEICIEEDSDGGEEDEDEDDDDMLWVIGPVFGIIASLIITALIFFLVKRKNKISASQTELIPGTSRKFSKTMMKT